MLPYHLQVIQDSVMTPNEKIFVLFLYYKGGDLKSSAFCIAEDTGMSQRSVQRSVQRLKARGTITVTKTKKPTGMIDANTYHLNK